MVESERVPGKGTITTSIEILSRRIREKGRIYVSTEKLVKSGRVPRKGRIPASIEKLSRRVPKNGQICVSTEKWQNPGEFRENVESLRVS